MADYTPPHPVDDPLLKPRFCCNDATSTLMLSSTDDILLRFSEPIALNPALGAQEYLTFTPSATKGSLQLGSRPSAVPIPGNSSCGVTKVAADQLKINPCEELAQNQWYDVAFPIGLVVDRALRPNAAVAAGEWCFKVRHTHIYVFPSACMCH